MFLYDSSCSFLFFLESYADLEKKNNESVIMDD